MKNNTLVLDFFFSILEEMKKWRLQYCNSYFQFSFLQKNEWPFEYTDYTSAWFSLFLFKVTLKIEIWVSKNQSVGVLSKKFASFNRRKLLLLKCFTSVNFVHLFKILSLFTDDLLTDLLQILKIQNKTL